MKKVELALSNCASVLDSRKLTRVSVSLQYVHSAGVIHRVCEAVDQILW